MPVPRGGGLAVMTVVLVAWTLFAFLGNAPADTIVIVVAAAGLTLISWFDDLRGLPIAARLAAHSIAVALGVWALPAGSIFQGLLPPLVDRLAAALLWVWFVNLFNFMDGIDGLTGIETASLGFGVAIVAASAGGAGFGIPGLALTAAAAALGFLRWNWHPARLFLGDSGSVPLGFVMGWLLLHLAVEGLWAAALILPLYYLADASVTLGRRVARRERFWQAHRQHFYQRALGPDGDHAAVARWIALDNIVLIALALAALWYPFAALAVAVLAVVGLLLFLQRRADSAARS